MPDYNLLGSTEVLEELQEGRTRELLLQLQDKEIAVSKQPPNNWIVNLTTDKRGDYILSGDIGGLVDDAEDADTTEWTTTRNNGVEATTTKAHSGSYSLRSFFDGIAFSSAVSLPGDGLDNYPSAGDEFEFWFNITSTNNNFVIRYAVQGSTTRPDSYLITISSGSIRFEVRESSNNTTLDSTDYFPSVNTWVRVEVTWTNGLHILEFYEGGTKQATLTAVDGTYNSGGIGVQANSKSGLAEIYIDDWIITNSNSGNLIDRFSARTTPPVDFKQWKSIQARDVTTGASTSPDPVEFEILDSTYSTINSARIPKSRIADEPFTMRNRVYSEDTGSNGQSDFPIPTTGNGGHFGIPILTVVSVKKNGSVLESDNWTFDGNTAVTIDTSNVSITSGDTIEIKYDFDVFDSTLSPRAYLNREDTSETSPSVSHFKYEYVI